MQNNIHIQTDQQQRNFTRILDFVKSNSVFFMSKLWNTAFCNLKWQPLYHQHIQFSNNSLVKYFLVHIQWCNKAPTITNYSSYQHRKLSTSLKYASTNESSLCWFVLQHLYQDQHVVFIVLHKEHISRAADLMIN